MKRAIGIDPGSGGKAASSTRAYFYFWRFS
jgi:hypothetical protein